MEVSSLEIIYQSINDGFPLFTLFDYGRVAFQMKHMEVVEGAFQK
jgi:hypothetical protein